MKKERPQTNNRDRAPSAGHENGWMSREDYRQKTHGRRRPSRRERRREQAMFDWYGTHRGAEEIVAQRSSFDEIGDVLKETFSRFGMQKAVVLEEIQQSWADIVGQDVSRVTRPSSVKADTVEVEVVNPAWMYILDREYKTTMEQNLRNQTGSKVRNIRLLPAGRRPRE